MIRKFCFISTILVLVFALSTVLWAQETKKPDYLKAKEEAVKKEIRGEEARKPVKSERATELEKLSEQLKEIQAQLEKVSPDTDEGKKLEGRMKEIRRRIAQLRARGERKLRARRLSGRNLETRIKGLQDSIAKDNRQIAELKETNPDSPKLKELQQKVEERERELRQLTAQQRRLRAERTPARRVEQTQLKIFQLKHIDVEAAFEIVKPFVKRATGVIVPVPHTKSLIIRDTQKNLRDIEMIIKHIDVEAKE